MIRRGERRFAAMIVEKTGSWLTVFGLVFGMDIPTRLLALFVLKGMRGG